ncbi:MAG: alpha/beta fold hydrolase [Acidimicrobiales bacterium]
MNDLVTAQEWFSLGTRVPYDPAAKKILKAGEATGAADVVQVFERVDRGDGQDEAAVWTTFMPGYPDGSYGWAAVDQHLRSTKNVPKLFVEFVGQGDSDKPAKYPYGTMERADLVEAMWQADGIRSTFLVTFDYSSLAALELLSRQLERCEKGADLDTAITGVLMINGGLFADAHSHPFMTTPLLGSPLGPPFTWIAQRSAFVLNQMLRTMISKGYPVSPEELREIGEAICRRDGARFMSRAARFRHEHQTKYAQRWDLGRLFHALQDSVSFHIVGSEDDPFEPNQVIKARERLGDQGLDIRMVPGGHLTTLEHPEQLARIIEDVAPN